MTLRACTSKNVMPRKPGVSNDLVMAPRSNSAGRRRAAAGGVRGPGGGAVRSLGPGGVRLDPQLVPSHERHSRILVR